MFNISIKNLKTLRRRGFVTSHLVNRKRIYDPEQVKAALSRVIIRKAHENEIQGSR